MVADLLVADCELLPAFHIGRYNRLGIQLAKDEPLLIVAVVNEEPHPFLFCGLLVEDFDFDVIALLVFAHYALTLHFIATHTPKCGGSVRRTPFGAQGKQGDGMASGGEPSDGDAVFGLDQAAWVVVGGHVMEMNVARRGAEEEDAVSNEHRDASDDEALWRDRDGAPTALGIFCLGSQP